MLHELHVYIRLQSTIFIGCRVEVGGATSVVLLELANRSLQNLAASCGRAEWWVILARPNLHTPKTNLLRAKLGG